VLKIENINIADIKPFERNAKEHPKEQVEQIKKSISEFGMNDPIALDENNVIIEGHGRLLALKELRVDTVPCIRLTHLSEKQKRAYILAHNKLTLNSGFDTEMLLGEFDFLKDAGFDTALTGFSADELEKLFSENDKSEAKDDDFDVTAALEKAAFVMRGDVWSIGRHRLMVGDATDSADVERLMNGKKAHLALTDVPYGVNYKGTNGLTIKNDNLNDEDFYNFLYASFKNMRDALDVAGTIYSFYADKRALVTLRAFDDAGFKSAGGCIWVKPSIVLGHADYQYEHEVLVWGWRKDGKHKFYGDRKCSTVWHFDKSKRNAEHPNQKPLDLMAYPIQNSSRPNSIVLDSFCGSGSTLIACEQTNRICYCMELDPKYASVIVKRYIEAVGSADDVFVERDCRTLPYTEVVQCESD